MYTPGRNHGCCGTRDRDYGRNCRWLLGWSCLKLTLVRRSLRDGGDLGEKPDRHDGIVGESRLNPAANVGAYQCTRLLVAITAATSSESMGAMAPGSRPVGIQ